MGGEKRNPRPSDPDQTQISRSIRSINPSKKVKLPVTNTCHLQQPLVLQKDTSILNSLEPELENPDLVDHYHANDQGGHMGVIRVGLTLLKPPSVHC